MIKEGTTLKVKQYCLIIGLFIAKSLMPSSGEQLRKLNLVNPTYPKATKAISQTNLSSSATNMYTIQQSGRYYLETPLQAVPSGTNRNVIKVTANNVTLDLNGMSLSQINTTAGLNGIDIASGVSNVIIMNGFINNLSDVGINVGTNCNNIRIVNVKVNNCDGGGLQFNTVQNIALKDVSATNCNGTGTTAPGNDAVGLYMTTCDKIGRAHV